MRPISLVFLVIALLLAGCDLISELTNRAPQVSISQPSEGAVLTQGDSVTVETSASDSDGDVARVEFTFGDRSLGSAEQAPFSRTFTPDETGTFSLTALAYDDDDTVSDPASVEVRVEPAPIDTFNVRVTVTGSGTVTSEPTGIDCTQTCAKNFDDGTAVTLSAQPSAGENFLGWGGDCSGDTCTVTGGSSVTATFSETEPGPGPGTGSVEPFTLIALPDTQAYVCCDGRLGEPETFRAQTQWIVDNLEDLNIAFVTHVGDVVDDASDEQEWRDGDAAMDLLDGQVPYSVAVGDHDYFPEEFHDGDTSLYREYFGASRYEGYPWYGGTGPGGLNHYQRFDGGGVTFLHIALEWEAPPVALTWAEGVIEDNPGVPTIITTHAYLRDGIRGRTAQTEACVTPASRPCDDPGNDEDAASGEKIFQTLVKPYPQVFMVLNGHYHDNGRRFSNPDIGGCDIDAPGYETSTENYRKCNNGEYHQVSTNSAGSNVYEMLSNYQDYENGGNGWLRIIEFRPGEGAGGLDRIEVETYSPTLEESQSGEASRFSFDLNFTERFGLSE